MTKEQGKAFMRAMMASTFPKVLFSSEDGHDETIVIACSPDLIIWLKNGRIHQTWKRGLRQ